MTGNAAVLKKNNPQQVGVIFVFFGMRKKNNSFHNQNIRSNFKKTTYFYITY